MDLAAEQDLGDLAAALATCRASEWRGEATPKGDSSPKELDAPQYHERINSWFDEEVGPVLQKLREGAVLYN